MSRRRARPNGWPLPASAVLLTRSQRGTASVDEKFVPAKKYRAFRLTATMEGAEESVTIEPPPFTAPPPGQAGQAAAGGQTSGGGK